MEEKNLKAKDLAEILHVSKGLVSDILNYKKGLSKEIIRSLSDYFKVSQEAFNRPYELKAAEKTQIKNLGYCEDYCLGYSCWSGDTTTAKKSKKRRIKSPHNPKRENPSKLRRATFRRCKHYEIIVICEEDKKAKKFFCPRAGTGNTHDGMRYAGSKIFSITKIRKWLRTILHLPFHSFFHCECKSKKSRTSLDLLPIGDTPVQVNLIV